MNSKMDIYLRFEFKSVALNCAIEQLEKVRRLSGFLKPGMAVII